MAKFTSIDSVITVGGVDLSDCIESVQLPEEVDSLDSTNFGSAGVRTYNPGLRKADVQLGFFQDFSASKTAATLRPLLGTYAAVVVKPRNTAVSVTNPQYTCNALVTKYDDLSGNIGQLGKMSLQWPISGAITVATA